MHRDPLDHTATPHRVWMLFREGVLPPKAWPRAQIHTRQRPTVGEWLAYLDRLLLILGAVFLVAGVVFFFAFNWADMPRFAKFALLQGLVVGTASAAFVVRLERWGGRVLLGASAILLGVALAVIGQAYQTGADSYRLFVNWLMLITGWVIVSRWNVLWLMWVVLANVALSMYWWQVIGRYELQLNLILAGFNYGFLVAWELMAWRGPFDWMRRGMWFQSLLMVPVLGYATFNMLDMIFSFSYRYVSLGNFGVLFYALVLAGNLVMYAGGLRRDLSILALTALSVLVVLVSGIARGLYEILDFADILDGYFYTFAMGLITIGLSAALGYGLRTLQQRWGVEA